MYRIAYSVHRHSYSSVQEFTYRCKQENSKTLWFQYFQLAIRLLLDGYDPYPDPCYEDAVDEDYYDDYDREVDTRMDDNFYIGDGDG